MFSPDTILQRARNLLHLSKNAGTPEEAAAAAAALSKTMLRYNLTIDTIANAQDSEYTEERIEITERRPTAQWWCHLYACLAAGNDCVAVHSHDYNLIILLGRKHNVTLVKHLHAYLRTVLQGFSDTVKEQAPPTQQKSYVRSFYLGAISGIATQLKTMRDTVQQEQAHNKALMVRNERVLAEELLKRYPQVETKTVQPSNPEAFLVGHSVGEAIPLHPQIPTTKPKRKRRRLHDPY